MEDELDDAGAVAQVDEDQAAVVAAAVDPAGDPGLGVDPVGEHLAAPGVAVAVRAQSAGASLTLSSGQLLDRPCRGRPARCSPLSMSRSCAEPSASRMSDAAGADPVGVLELALEAAAGRGRPRPRARRCAARSPAPAPAARCPSSATATKASRPGSASLLVERQQDPLDPRRPADRRRRRPAELLDQAVVAAAAADLRLGAERVADEGEDRPRVVVEAADQGRVDLVGDAGGVEQRPDLGEVLGVLALEPLDDRRRARHHPPRPLVVGVEGAQRVDRRSARARPSRARPRARAGGPSAPPGRRGARPSEPRLPSRSSTPGTPSSAEQVGEQHDHLGVGERRVGADRLDPDLVELAVAAGLGALVAEERARRRRASPAAPVCASRARGRRGRSAPSPRAAG